MKGTLRTHEYDPFWTGGHSSYFPALSTPSDEVWALVRMTLQMQVDQTTTGNRLFAIWLGTPGNTGGATVIMRSGVQVSTAGTGMQTYVDDVDGVGERPDYTPITDFLYDSPQHFPYSSRLYLPRPLLMFPGNNFGGVLYTYGADVTRLYYQYISYPLDEFLREWRP